MFGTYEKIKGYTKAEAFFPFSNPGEMKNTFQVKRWNGFGNTAPVKTYELLSIDVKEDKTQAY